MNTTKVCKGCGAEKELEAFYVSRSNPSKHQNTCKKCQSAYVITYYHTPRGFRNMKYSNLKARVKGHPTFRNNSKGKALLTEAQYSEWCVLTNETFMALFSDWEDNNYLTDFAPSIDRIENDLDYTLGNIQWLTHKENMAKGTK